MNQHALEQLIQDYSAAARSYGRAILGGCTNKSDTSFDDIETTFGRIKETGKPGLQALSTLLESSDESVRLWASSHLLNYSEFQSAVVLEEICSSPSVLALTAQVTLDRWKQGYITY